MNAKYGKEALAQMLSKLDEDDKQMLNVLIHSERQRCISIVRQWLGSYPENALLREVLRDLISP